MGVLVRLRSDQGATVVELDGPSDPDLLARVGEAIARLRVDDASPLVLDITGLAMAHPRGVAALVEHLGDAEREPLRLVCRRLSGRRLVRRARIPGLVYASVAAAVADATRPVSGPSVVTGPAVLDLTDAATAAVLDALRDPGRSTGSGPGAHVIPG